jgi:hypothetical protein
VRDLAVLFLHLVATVARLAGPGGVRSVVAESVLVKHQLLILNRSRKRSPNLRFSDRVVAGLSFLRATTISVVSMRSRVAQSRPNHLARSDIGAQVSTFWQAHRATSKHQRPSRVLGLLFRVGYAIHFQALLVDQRDHAALVRQRKGLLDGQDARAAGSH